MCGWTEKFKLVNRESQYFCSQNLFLRCYVKDINHRGSLLWSCPGHNSSDWSRGTGGFQSVLLPGGPQDSQGDPESSPAALARAADMVWVLPGQQREIYMGRNLEVALDQKALPKNVTVRISSCRDSWACCCPGRVAGILPVWGVSR